MAAKSKTYELAVKIAGKYDSSMKKACLDAAFAAKLTFALDAKETKKFLFAMVCETDAGRAVDAFRAVRKDSYPEIQRRYMEVARRMLAECDMTETELQLERAVLPHLIYRLAQTPVDRAAPCDKTQADLWKYGVSGDDPILLVRVYEVEDVPKIMAPSPSCRAPRDTRDVKPSSTPVAMVASRAAGCTPCASG